MDHGGLQNPLIRPAIFPGRNVAFSGEKRRLKIPISLCFLDIHSPLRRFGMTGPPKYVKKNTKPQEVYDWMSRVVGFAKKTLRIVFGV